MTINNGDMPARPLSGDAYQDYAGYDGTSKTSYNPECQGLTKREHFAAMAMQGMLSNTEITNPNAVNISQTAVLIANEMLKALEEKQA